MRSCGRVGANSETFTVMCIVCLGFETASCSNEGGRRMFASIVSHLISNSYVSPACFLAQRSSMHSGKHSSDRTEDVQDVAAGKIEHSIESDEVSLPASAELLVDAGVRGCRFTCFCPANAMFCVSSFSPSSSNPPIHTSCCSTPLH